MGSNYEEHLWKGESGYPTLYLDDVSEIPFLVNIVGVEEYQHRARVRAGAGDLYAAVTPPVEGYEEYCRDTLRMGSPEPVIAEIVTSPLAVAKACGRGTALAHIIARARVAGGLLIHPYMSIEPVWELAARVAADAKVPVKVIGPPPPVTWIANDKKSFGALVEQTMGKVWLVRTEIAREPDAIAHHLREVAKTCARVGLKRTRCASAMGNAVFDSSELLEQDVEDVVREFLKRTEWDGVEDVLAVAWEQTDLSPSTQTWIPPRGQGKPIIEGVYEQILEGPEKVFVGSRPLKLTHPIAVELGIASTRVATALQELGYVGRCSFDFIVLDDERARFTECNGRWGGTSIPMSLVDRLVPGNRPPYRAQDFVSELLVGTSFEEVQSRLRNDLYHPASGEGRFILYNVGPLSESGKLDVIALGETQQEAEAAAEVELPERFL